MSNISKLFNRNSLKCWIVKILLNSLNKSSYSIDYSIFFMALSNDLILSNLVVPSLLTILLNHFNHNKNM